MNIMQTSFKLIDVIKNEIEELKMEENSKLYKLLFLASCFAGVKVSKN